MKKIDFIYDEDDILREVITENREFSIADFYLNKNLKTPRDVLFGKRNYSEPDGALGIITKRQTIFCYSWDDHTTVYNHICSILYKDFSKYYSKDKELCELSEDLGNICIQICAFEVFVWIPKTINEYQYENLLNFWKEAKKVNRIRKKLIDYEVPYVTNIFLNHKSLTLEKALPIIRERIKEKEDIEEIIIDDITSIKQKSYTKKQKVTLK